MEALTCYATASDRPATGMEVRLRYITERKDMRDIEFKSHILSSGKSGPWKPRMGISLKYFMQNICTSHESRWYLVFRTGKCIGRGEISYEMVPVFISLRRTELRTVRLTLSPGHYHIVTDVSPAFTAQVCCF